MIDFLNHIVISNEFPLLTAFVFGLLVAVSPCTIAANITAITYITEGSKKNAIITKGLIYVLGRTFAYTLLGVILYFFVDGVSFGQWLQLNFGKILGPLFIVLGLLLLDIIHIHFLADRCVNNFNMSSIKTKSWSPLLAGVIMAYAFCPYSGALYFGAMVPLMFTSSLSVYIPLAFAVGSALPLIPIILIISGGLEKLNQLKEKHGDAETWIRRIIALFFIIAGCMFVYEYYLE